MPIYSPRVRVRGCVVQWPLPPRSAAAVIVQVSRKERVNSQFPRSAKPFLDSIVCVLEVVIEAGLIKVEAKGIVTSRGNICFSGLLRLEDIGRVLAA